MLRALLRDKIYTQINVAGLSLAIASCVVLGMYLRSELAYDRHNALHERIYRVEAEFKSDGRSQRVATTPGVRAPMRMQRWTAGWKDSPIAPTWEPLRPHMHGQ